MYILNLMQYLYILYTTSVSFRGARREHPIESNGRHPAVHTPRLLACKKRGEDLCVVSSLRALSRGGWLGFDTVMVNLDNL